ncbi:hypothetical protein EON66_04120 [archaeon]|nr:MAG: hypothetical protein EON66_04120 [archaeon]
MHLAAARTSHCAHCAANFWIVCELCSGGELMARVLSSALFSEQDAAWYFRQMLLGVQHCHNHLVVHRDLKPENFLLHSSDAKPIVKLTDFGLSTAISSPDAEMTDGLGYVTVCASTWCHHVSTH